MTKILSWLISFIKPKSGKTVIQRGNNNSITETNINNSRGVSGKVVLLILVVMVLGFVTLTHIIASRTQTEVQEKSCKTCKIDINLTPKMLNEIQHDPGMAADIARRSNIDLTRVPDGYFVAFERIDPLLSDIIDNKLGDVVGIRPDLSVSRRFNSEARKNYPELYAKRKPCKELYIDRESNRSKKIPLTCYPDELAPVFDRFFRNVYQELYQQTYIENIKRDKIKLIQEARDAREAKEMARENRKKSKY